MFRLLKFMQPRYKRDPGNDFEIYAINYGSGQQALFIVRKNKET